MTKIVKTKSTVGKIATDLQKQQPQKIKVLDQAAEMKKDYMNNLFEAVDRGCKLYDTDFFIHVETKQEPLLPNVFRDYFILLKNCPTPNYDQSVFKYNRQAGQIEYIWTIPDRDTCHHLKMHATEVVPEERQLLYYVLKYTDGTLFKLMKKLNGEKLETPELIKG